MNNKPLFVTFADKKIESAFDELKEGKFEDKKLYAFIDRAIDDLKKDPTSGTKIPKEIWPRVYIQKYDINNLFKYDLPNGWRLIYTIKSDEVRIISVILEWFDHNGYEKRFRY